MQNSRRGLEAPSEALELVQLIQFHLQKFRWSIPGPNMTLVKGLDAASPSVKARLDNNLRKLSIWLRPDGEHEPIPWHDMLGEFQEKSSCQNVGKV